MSSGTSAKCAYYYLYPKQYVIPPNSLRACPVCGKALTESNISPSKAVTSFLATATMPYHNFSRLYECPACHWWAVWESFGDAEYSPDYSVLLASIPDADQAPLDEPWKQALEDESVYDHEMPLPRSLEQVLAGGKKRMIDFPKPADKVRLVGDVHVLRDLELIPLFISGSEGTIVTDEELYVFFQEETKQEAELLETQWKNVGVDDWDVDKYIRGQFEKLKWTLEAKNCCPVRLEKLVVSQDKQLHDLPKEGAVYFIYAADILKMV